MRTPPGCPRTARNQAFGRLSARGTSALVAAALALAACKREDAAPPAPITAAWTDDFERGDLGGDWRPTSDVYQLVNGALSARGARNRPLWLKRALPRDAVIELDVWSNTPDGDIKVELYGDGRSFDRDGGRYTSTGYVVVMGGWNNTKSILAKGDEHGEALVERPAPKVEPGKRYHWKIVRKGGRIEWFVNDMTAPFLVLNDAEPLGGPGHQYFAIANWQSDSWFDDLRIAPLEAETAAPGAPAQP